MADRILVTGSRTWEDYEVICRVLRPLWILRPGAVLVSGACPDGADALCERAWKQLGGWAERHRIQLFARYGKMAGYRRNEYMVHLGADICVAFIMPCKYPACRLEPPSRDLAYHGTHGSVHCADYAEDHLIPVRRFTPILAA